MKRVFISQMTIVLTLLLFCFTGVTTAYGQEVDPDGSVDGPPIIGDPNDFPEPVEEDEIEAAAPEFILAQPPYTMNYAGYVTDGSGNPINGEHLFGVSLWNADGNSGDLRWGPESHADVPVTHGLFNLVLGETVELRPDVFDEALWLRITVDGTALPRIPLRPSAYAFGLVPGAEVQGVPSDNGYALEVRNEDGDATGGTGLYSYGTYDGIYAYGARYGLYANTSESNGDAVYSVDFVNALGYRSRRDSWFYTPGFDGEFYSGSSNVQRFNHFKGYSALSTTGGTQNVAFYVPVRVPAILMGQEVRIERVVVHYKTSNTDTYISDVELYKQIDYGDDTQELYDSGSVTLNATTATSYGLTPVNDPLTPEDDRILNEDEGVLMLRLYVHLEPSDTLYVNAVGARIGHTE